MRSFKDTAIEKFNEINKIKITDFKKADKEILKKFNIDTITGIDAIYLNDSSEDCIITKITDTKLKITDFAEYFIAMCILSKFKNITSIILVSQENLIPEIIKHTNVQIININKQQSKKKAVPNELIVEIVKDFIKTSGKIDNEAIKIDENKDAYKFPADKLVYTYKGIDYNLGNKFHNLKYSDANKSIKDELEKIFNQRLTPASEKQNTSVDSKIQVLIKYLEEQIGEVKISRDFEFEGVKLKRVAEKVILENKPEHSDVIRFIKEKMGESREGTNKWKQKYFDYINPATTKKQKGEIKTSVKRFAQKMKINDNIILPEDIDDCKTITEVKCYLIKNIIPEHNLNKFIIIGQKQTAKQENSIEDISNEIVEYLTLNKHITDFTVSNSDDYKILNFKNPIHNLVIVVWCMINNNIPKFSRRLRNLKLKISNIEFIEYDSETDDVINIMNYANRIYKSKYSNEINNIVERVKELI